ncbi:DUF3732 domain-containing protein [Octadecabacter sp. R77987]|uniref:DUF3732 domain-containing protein n=1 Tax=Octadecabacter sp. R77987 TaxID=3093874 RepID=UPI003670D972
MPISEAKKHIERAFGIVDLEDADTEEKYTVGRATVRHVTPYLFLNADVIISSETTLHDLNNPNKARDVRATLPFFLGAVNQRTVQAQRELRKLENELKRLERQAKGQEKARSLVTDRAMSLLAQAKNIGMAEEDFEDFSETDMLSALTAVSSIDVEAITSVGADELSILESQRRETLSSIQNLRSERDALKALTRDAKGFDQAVVGQKAKLDIVSHLNLSADTCPVCDQETDLGGKLAQSIGNALSQISSEVAAIQQAAPELMNQLEVAEGRVTSAYRDLREIEAQIRAIIQQNEALRGAKDRAQARALTKGRIIQFLETTTEDFKSEVVDLKGMRDRIERLRDLVDPQALLDSLADATNMVSNYSTEMVGALPSTEPLAMARLQFNAQADVHVIEPEERRRISLASVGSDQNYQSIHLALYFGLHRHFAYASSPVPGLLVIDQISRPYFPSDSDDERPIEERGKDEERRALTQVVDFIFAETAKSQGLQVLLIEHAFIENDKRYVDATIERWTGESGIKLIPEDWPQRD